MTDAAALEARLREFHNTTVMLMLERATNDFVRTGEKTITSIYATTLRITRFHPAEGDDRLGFTLHPLPSDLALIPHEETPAFILTLRKPFESGQPARTEEVFHVRLITANSVFVIEDVA